MFADLTGFTPLTAAMGDDAAADVLQRFGALVRRACADNFGRIVKQIGDAFMLVFDGGRDAVLCGVQIRDLCGNEVRFPAVHIGAHTGEALFRDGNYVGNTVNLTARVASATLPGQFLVTADVVRDLDLPGQITLSPQPPRPDKGIREPVQTVAVGTPRSRRVRVTDPVCGMELDPEGDAVRRTIDGTQWRFCSDACAAVHTTLPSPGRVDGQG